MTGGWKAKRKVLKAVWGAVCGNNFDVILAAYGQVLAVESRHGTLISERKLPYSRDQIKQAIVEKLRKPAVVSDTDYHAWKEAYARLAYFIADEEADQAIKGEVFMNQFGGLDLMSPEQDAVLREELDRGLMYYEKFKACRQKAEALSRQLYQELQTQLL
jgi:hypothetical protein